MRTIPLGETEEFFNRPGMTDVLDGACSARIGLEREETAYNIALNNDTNYLKNRLGFSLKAEAILTVLIGVSTLLNFTPQELIPFVLALPVIYGLYETIKVKRAMSKTHFSLNKINVDTHELNKIEDRVALPFGTYDNRN